MHYAESLRWSAGHPDRRGQALSRVSICHSCSSLLPVLVLTQSNCTLNNRDQSTVIHEVRQISVKSLPVVFKEAHCKAVKVELHLALSDHACRPGPRLSAGHRAWWATCTQGCLLGGHLNPGLALTHHPCTLALTRPSRVPSLCNNRCLHSLRPLTVCTVAGQTYTQGLLFWVKYECG